MTSLPCGGLSLNSKIRFARILQGTLLQWFFSSFLDFGPKTPTAPSNSTDDAWPTYDAMGGGSIFVEDLGGRRVASQDKLLAQPCPQIRAPVYKETRVG